MSFVFEEGVVAFVIVASVVIAIVEEVVATIVVAMITFWGCVARCKGE